MVEELRREVASALTGEYQHSLDSKGRIFVPAKLRDELGEVFYITLSMDRCLNAYSSEAWQSLSDKVSAMPYVKQRKMRPLFAHAAKCELDSQGRALIPKRYAAIPNGHWLASMPMKESLVQEQTNARNSKE